MIDLAKQKDSAKLYMLNLLPELMQILGIPPFFLGFNVLDFAKKRVNAMSECQAAKTLNDLKKVMSNWKT